MGLCGCRCVSGKTTFPSRSSPRPGFHREPPDALQHDGRAFRIAIGEHLPGLRDLRHEDQVFNDFAVGLRKGLHQEDSPFRIDFHVAVTKTGNLHRDRTATSTLRDLVHDFL